MCVRVGTSPRGERMASRRAIAGAPSSVARCGGASVNARRARVARARRRRARATREGDEDAELESASASASAPAASRAHAGPHDVEVKRTTPRPTRAVTRTGAAATKSAKRAPKVSARGRRRDSRRERERVSRAGAGAAGRFGDARERGREGKIPVRRWIRVREGDVRDGGRWWRSRRRWSGKSDACGWKTFWSIEVFRVAADSRGRLRRRQYLGGVSDDGGAGDRVRVDRELEGAVVQGEREDVGRGAEVATRGAV